jgi:hypothetical protein
MAATDVVNPVPAAIVTPAPAAAVPSSAAAQQAPAAPSALRLVGSRLKDYAVSTFEQVTT